MSADLLKYLVTAEERANLYWIICASCHLQIRAPRIPFVPAIWLGFFTLLAMHLYILLMPAPFDVYSWNLCFGCSRLLAEWSTKAPERLEWDLVQASGYGCGVASCTGNC